MSVKKLEKKAKPEVKEEVKETEVLQEEIEETAETAADEVVEETAEAVEAAEVKEETAPEEPNEKEKTQAKKGPLYQVAYKRDDSVLEAFITFNYRVVHPKVLLRSILYAIVFITFGVVASSAVFSAICFLLAFFCIGLVLFRKNISLSMTKKDDEDYQNGTVFTYNFTENGARMLRNNKPEVYAKSYKGSVKAFFGDQEFYYLALSSDDLFVLPKARFTIGDPEEFEKFIIEKTGLEMRWIPRGMKGVLNSLKHFSEQPMIDTQGWKDIINHQREKRAANRSEASRREADRQSQAENKVKPKALKDKSKKDK